MRTTATARQTFECNLDSSRPQDALVTCAVSLKAKLDKMVSVAFPGPPGPYSNKCVASVLKFDPAYVAEHERIGRTWEQTNDKKTPCTCSETETALASS